MKVVLYGIIFFCGLISMFFLSIYLMTVVDPDLMDLPKKARMIMSPNYTIDDDRLEVSTSIH